jgi:subtilisin family serine protease
MASVVAVATPGQVSAQVAVETGAGEIFQWSHDSINTAGAWAQGVDGTGITVAVVDSGVVDSSSDLSGRVIARADFLNKNSDKRHGTNVASIISAAPSNGGVTGVAPGSRILDAVACSAGECPSGSVTKAILWAVEQEADVINLSVGAGWKPEISAAVSWAVSQGVVVVAASGNNKCVSNENSTTNYSCTTNQTNVDWPARLSQVISVGALKENGVRANYSSWGPQVDIAAPTDVPTVSTWQYSVFGGTSAATPQVSGVVALALQANPSLQVPKNQTARKIQALLQAGATSLDLGVGSGAPHQRWLVGAGGLNAQRVVELAKSATFDVQASVTAEGELVFNQGWASTYVGGSIKIDSKDIGVMEINREYIIPNYEPGVQYAVSVSKNNYTGLALLAGPDTDLPVPTVRSAVYKNDGVEVEAAKQPDSALGLSLYDAEGRLVDGCSNSGESTNSVSYRCSNVEVTSTSGSYTVRYIDEHGVSGATSSSFVVSGAEAVTLTKPEIQRFGNAGSTMELVFTESVGALSYLVNYRVRGSDSTIMVNSDGTLGVSTGVIPVFNCSVGQSTVTCSHPLGAADDGVTFEVSVIADLDDSNSSFNSLRSRVVSHAVEILPVAAATDIIYGKLVKKTDGKYQVTVKWERGQGENVIDYFKVYIGTKYFIATYTGSDNVWSAELEVRDTSLEGLDYDKMSITVVGYRERNGTTFNGTGKTVLLEIPVVKADVFKAPDVTCERENGVVTCARRDGDTRPLEVLYMSGDTVAHRSPYIKNQTFNVDDGYVLKMRYRSSFLNKSDYLSNYGDQKFLRSELATIQITNVPAEENLPPTDPENPQDDTTVPPTTTPASPPVTPPVTVPVTAPPTTTPPVTTPPVTLPTTTTQPPVVEEPETLLTAAGPIHFNVAIIDAGVVVHTGSKVSVVVARQSVKVCRVSGKYIRFKEDGYCKIEVKVRLRGKVVSAGSFGYASIEDPSSPVYMSVHKNGSVLPGIVGGSLNLLQLTEYLEMTYPRSAKVSVSVASKYKKTCKYVSKSLRLLKAGVCPVSVKVTIRGKTRLVGTVLIEVS